ncbi:hypothetical protein GIB67_004235 [Kingdonia uniflora]|uniref:TORTIFOLIA1/SINE1-2 N-terminal domain-containing protein n=1 Tax=Kingdonia uniflora TaxID=39325 RepID=A0A7J7MR50_9MAGN|nr:hypothetical protein GIB67_004235 [Kingdonia uniflora]
MFPESSDTPPPMPKRSSPISQTGSTHHELKHRVNSCLNKLSDRDTLAIATTELESMARSLSHDSFSPFLTCILNTDSSEKTLVRKQCVKVLGFVSRIHGDQIGAPHLVKMVGYVVRRLRDSDSSVRSACVEAITVMAGMSTKVSFSLFFKPFMEAIVHEQDYNMQIGATLCLTSAIEAFPDVDRPQLVRVLPKLVKLLRSECFKAKPALLSLIGTIVGSGGSAVVGHNLLGNLVTCLVEFLSSEDWTARKAAAEAIAKLAVAERERLSEFKTWCLAIFEARRFDKVKVVRDTINQMMETWKDVPDVSHEVLQPLRAKSSSPDNASDGRFPNDLKCCDSISTTSYESPQAKCKTISSRSPPPNSSSATSTARRRSPLNIVDKNVSQRMFHKLDYKKPANGNIEVSVPHTPLSNGCVNDVKKRVRVLEEIESNKQQSNTQARHTFFNKNSSAKFRRPRGGSRVVPFHDESSGSIVVGSSRTEELYANTKDNEDLSLIRKQLVQIENQQSSLLDLLQRFMGSSQNGIRSLETRVHGLEKALNEISYDLGVSTGRMTNSESARSTCCQLPGAEYLSPKFWKKSEDRHSTSMCSSGFSVNPLADICIESKMNLNNHLDRRRANVTRTTELQTRKGSGVDVSLSDHLQSGEAKKRPSLIRPEDERRRHSDTFIWESLQCK